MYIHRFPYVCVAVLGIEGVGGKYWDRFMYLCTVYCTEKVEICEGERSAGNSSLFPFLAEKLSSLASRPRVLDLL